MNAIDEIEASGLLQMMFGDDAKVSVVSEGMPTSGALIDSLMARVSVGGKAIDLFLLRLKTSSMASLRDAVLVVSGLGEKYGQPIIWANELSEVKQDYLRQAKISFLDDAGNAWLSNGTVHIDVRGRKSLRKAKVSTQQANVFSDKATIVLRILLEHDSIGIREISRVAIAKGFSLTPGYVSKTVASLETQGYAVKDKGGSVSLRHRYEMLEDWAFAYKKLSPVQMKRFFLPVSDSGELVIKAAQLTKKSAILSELAAASLIDPYAVFDSVLLLSRDFDGAASNLLAGGAREVDRGANIRLVLPRYKVSAFWGEQKVKDCHMASNLQVYLDLLRQPKRGLEAAEHLYERMLVTMFGGEACRE